MARHQEIDNYFVEEEQYVILQITQSYDNDIDN